MIESDVKKQDRAVENYIMGVFDKMVRHHDWETYTVTLSFRGRRILNGFELVGLKTYESIKTDNKNCGELQCTEECKNG